MSSYFAWFGLPGTFVLTVLMSALALVLALLRPSAHRWLCFAAMAFSTGGDLFLTNFRGLGNLPNSFVIGACLFGIAHVLYLLTYRKLSALRGYPTLNRFGLIPALLAAVGSVAFFTYMCARRSDFSMFPLCMAYLVLISANTATILSYAASAFRKRPAAIFAALGAVSFFISDFIIGLDMLAGIPGFGHLIWWYYPIGQILIISSAE
jgi:uncharacterized membrane protein YhhN